jgi:hypothetical protein
MKTKHYPGDVYRRMDNGRYIRIGQEWDGFPMDGIWLVQYGKASQRFLIGLNERVPIFALNYRQHEQGVVDAIQAREKVGKMSLYDMVRVVCDYFADVAAKQVEDKQR